MHTQQGHRQSALSERSPVHRRAEPQYNTDITRTSGDTQHPPAVMCGFGGSGGGRGGTALQTKTQE